MSMSRRDTFQVAELEGSPNQNLSVETLCKIPDVFGLIGNLQVLTQSLHIRVNSVIHIYIVFSILLELSHGIILCEYLSPRGMRMGSGKGFTMRKFIVRTVHLI